MRCLFLSDHSAPTEDLLASLSTFGLTLDHVDRFEDAEACLTEMSFRSILLARQFDECPSASMTWLRGQRQRRNTTPVIVVNFEAAARGDVAQALQAGADDYVQAPLDAEEIAARLYAIDRRAPEVAEDLLELGDLTVNRSTQELYIKNRAVDIASREYKLLSILIARKGRQTTREAIEHELYAMSDYVTPNAIDVAVYRLRRLLTKSGSNIKIRTMRKVGYQLCEVTAKTAARPAA